MASGCARRVLGFASVAEEGRLIDRFCLQRGRQATGLGALILFLLAACGGGEELVRPDAATARTAGSTGQPAARRLPPGTRFALAEHAVGVAATHVQMKAIDEAVAQLEVALEHDPMNRRAQVLWGRVHLEQQRFEDALKAFGRALAIREDSEVLEWIGFVYLQWRFAVVDGTAGESAPPEGELARLAQDRFVRAIDVNPASTNARHNLGYTQRLTGQLQQSVQTLESVVRDAPDSVRSLYELGASYESVGRTDDARATYRRLLGVQPDHGPAQQALARLEA